MEYIDFKAPCGHFCRVNNPKTAQWDAMVCLFQLENGNACGKHVNCRYIEPEKPVETKELTEEDIQLLKNMKIGYETNS